MFYLSQDTDKHSFQVKDERADIIAEGCYGVDLAHRSALVLVTKTTITPTNYDLIDQLLSIIEHTLGHFNHARVFTWLPVFDGRFDLNQQKVNHKNECLMVVDTNYLTFDTHIDFDQEQYELITNKTVIESYSQALRDMTCANAYWAKEWTAQQMKDRIHSATGAVLIIDRANNDSCAFGRIFIVENNQARNEKLAYLTDITVSSQHQNKRLGSLVTSSLVKMYMGDNDPQLTRGIIFLWCAEEGVGAIASPKLYKKFGFEYSKESHRETALVYMDQFYKRAYS